MFAQEPLIDIPPWAQTSVALAVLILVLGLVIAGRLVLAREVTALQGERERERTLTELHVASLSREAETWRRAYEDERAAREAAERAAANAMVMGDVVAALVEGFRAAGRPGTRSK